MAVPNGAGTGTGTGTGPGGPGGGLRAAAGLYEQLKGEWGRKSPNLAKCGEALGRLKVALLDLNFLPTSGSAMTKQQLILAHWSPVEHPEEGHSLLRALHGPAQVLLLRLQGGAARVGVAAPAAGAEPAVPAVPEPRGRVPHRAGAAPGARHPGEPLHPAPRVPGAVPDGGQLQQSVPGQGQHPSRELHLLHRHPAGHHQGRDRGLHRGRLRADPVPRGGADPLLQLAPQDDRLRQKAGLGAGSLQLLQFWGAAAESRGPPDPLDGVGHAGDRVRPAAGDDRLKNTKFLLCLFSPFFFFCGFFFPPFPCLFLSLFLCFLAVFHGFWPLPTFKVVFFLFVSFFFLDGTPSKTVQKIILVPTLGPHSKISPNPVCSPYFSYFIAFLGLKWLFGGG
uniref:Uncharacterized protein n=1 Tax=Taeniopygia guttata TaxID=59729 RepID=A0A674GWS3_TAEGU